MRVPLSTRPQFSNAPRIDLREELTAQASRQHHKHGGEQANRTDHHEQAMIQGMGQLADVPPSPGLDRAFPASKRTCQHSAAGAGVLL